MTTRAHIGLWSTDTVPTARGCGRLHKRYMQCNIFHNVFSVWAKAIGSPRQRNRVPMRSKSPARWGRNGSENARTTISPVSCMVQPCASHRYSRQRIKDGIDNVRGQEEACRSVSDNGVTERIQNGQRPRG